MEIQSEGKATNRREMGLISEVDRKTIKDMRNAGVGYLVIGNTLGYSRDAVRNYCRRAGLDGKLGCIPSNSEDKVVHNIHVMNPTLQYIKIPPPFRGNALSISLAVALGSVQSS